MAKRVLPGFLSALLIIVILVTGIFGFAVLTDFMHLGRLLKVVSYIETQSINPVSIAELVDGAMKGMVESLDDPYSAYMKPKAYEELTAHIKGTYGGVGLLITIKEEQLMVLSPFKGTPAHKAGIAAGDIITKIDGKNTKRMDLDEAATLMKGEPGTEVVLTVSREDVPDKDYSIVREDVNIPTVTGEMLELEGNKDIGYINITMFSDTTGHDLEKVIADLKDEGVKSIVLDLRNNPGGALTAAVHVSDLLIPEGPIVHIKGREGSETYTADNEYLGLPMVVLVNKGSASASEIVAGAIKDTESGTILGETTFGKGLVQTVFSLGRGAAVKLTTAKYLTPDENDINEKGIVPDVVVEMDPEIEQKAVLTAPNMEIDKQLQKAVEIIEKEIK